MKKGFIFIPIIMMFAAGMCFTANAEEVDIIHYYSLDTENGTVSFDTSSGPSYTIDYLNGAIVDCSSEGAVIKNCDINGDQLTITVYSNERPQDSTYTFFISGEDITKYFFIDYPGILSFETSGGPSYTINYEEGSIVNCSSDGASLVECSLDGNQLTLTVYSDDRPQNTTYHFTVSEKDIIDHFHINVQEHTIDFDSTWGPSYLINYETKEILDCTSERAILKDCELNGDILTITVYSDELPHDMTYTFSLLDAPTDWPDDDEDTIDDYEINVYDRTISFDSSRGPFYRINYETKEILSCSSDGAEIKECEINGNILTITVYSDELPEDRTYTFTLPDERTITGVIRWNDNNDEDGVRPQQVTVYLLANGETISSTTASASDGWRYSFSDVDPMDDDGNRISYTIAEEPVTGYATGINGFYITNIYINIDEDVIDYLEINVQESTINFDTGHGPSYLINYETKEILSCSSDNATLKECEVNGNILTITVNSDELPIDRTYTFTLPDERTITGFIRWDDYYNNDSRPKQVTVYLLANGEVIHSTTVDASGNWCYAFTDIDPQDEDGNKISYTVAEDSVTGYEIIIDGFNITNTYVSPELNTPENTVRFRSSYGTEYRINYKTKEILYCSSDGALLKECEINGNILTITVYSNEVPADRTYTFTLPDKFTINGSVRWNDGNDAEGLRPDQVIIYLLANGKNISSTTVGTFDDMWNTYTFTDVDLLDSDGNIITYTVAMDPVTGYETTINGTDITNIHMIYSGQCGDDLTWSLRDGTLTVTGTGDMWDFRGEEDVPWQTTASLIEAVCLEQGVKSVGDHAFSNCINLTSVEFPDSLTNIGEWSFRDCTSLPDVTIPSNVDTIEGWAFSNCHSLTSVELPENLTRIDEWSFNGCTSLPRVTIPSNVDTIEGWAFGDCHSLTSVDLPEGLTTIGYGAFERCYELIDLEIPSTVTVIDEQAFNSCRSLTELTLPKGLLSIGDMSFNYCYGLESVTVPEGVTVLGQSVFSECQSLKTITLPESLTTIGDWTFYNCKSLSTLIIPDGVKSIGENAFYYCENLKMITLPSSLSSMGVYAFSHSGLESIIFRGDAPIFSRHEWDDGSKVFEGLTATAFYPADNATWTNEVRQNYGGTITWSPYDPAISLYDNTLTLPQGLTLISAEAFAGLTQGVNIIVPDTVTEIEDGAFVGSNVTILGKAGSYAEKYCRDNAIPFMEY